MIPDKAPAGDALFASHPRSYQRNRYVYPVLSRRSGGISIGINLNLDKICNFDCVYCQVDRGQPGEKAFVDLAILEGELEAMVAAVTEGAVFAGPPFRNAPAELRQLRDIAFSGDGEPTTFVNFDEIVGVSAKVRQRHALDGVKLVLITNASMFHRPAVRRGLSILDAHGGEVWAKLDAGTAAYYTRVARSAIPFSRILDNLRAAARERPLVIQTLLMRLAGEPPPDAEIAAYADRLAEITAAGGTVKLVQLHSVARPPAEAFVSALTRAELTAIAERVRRRTGLGVAVY